MTADRLTLLLRS